MEENALLDMTKCLICNIDKIHEYIDEVLCDYKDYTDPVSEIIAPAKTFFAIYTFAKRKKFKTFLVKYAKQLEFNGILDAEKLQNYFLNQKNVDFIAEIIDSAINSRSVISSSLLGVFAGQFIVDSKEIVYEDAVITHALKNMQDRDLYNFLVLMNCEKYKKNSYYIPQITLDEFEIFSGREQLEMSAQKLVSLQIFLSDRNPEGSKGYNITPISNRLYDFIEKSNVISAKIFTAIVEIMTRQRPISAAEVAFAELIRNKEQGLNK